MSKILIHNQLQPEVTMVSNFFIDHYMPAANGAFVKVYLYLLRHLLNDKLSISRIADELDETEKDINRALKYWEEQHLLALTRDNQHHITDITILNFNTINDSPTAQSKIENEPLPQINKKIDTYNDKNTSAELATLKQTESKKIHPKPNYSNAQIAVLTDIEEVKWMLSALEQYLERLLKQSDVQFVLYLYESLGFSAELILYLFEYCVSKNKKNISYIEAVALSWAEEGIDTVEKAEKATTIYSNGYHVVSKAFGLNRAPGYAEKQYLIRWFQTFGFDAILVEEACNRTILTTGKPDFRYADSILESWHKQDVKQFSDLAKLDEKHQRLAINGVSQKNPKTKTVQTGNTGSNNKFNAFPQRQHSDEYYDSLEKHLLNKK